MKSAPTDINLPYCLRQRHFRHDRKVRGRESTLVGASRFRCVIGVLQLSVCFDGDVSGNKDKVVSLAAMICSQVEIVPCSVFCADNGSLGEAVEVLSCDSGIRSFR